jgi:hypothetical protein
MNPFVWLQSLVTFRKQGGGFAVPVLDAGGRIQITTLSASPLAVGPSAPGTVDGSVLWHNTSSGYEGLYFRDQTRGKWLSVAETRYGFGHDNADNQLLRTDGIDTPATGTGHRLPRDGTITGFSALAVGGQVNKTLLIRINGVTVATLVLSTYALTDLTLNVDVAAGDRLDMYVDAPGVNVTDVVADVFMRWRDS